MFVSKASFCRGKLFLVKYRWPLLYPPASPPPAPRRTTNTRTPPAIPGASIQPAIRRAPLPPYFPRCAYYTQFGLCAVVVNAIRNTRRLVCLFVLFVCLVWFG